MKYKLEKAHIVDGGGTFSKFPSRLHDVIDGVNGGSPIVTESKLWDLSLPLAFIAESYRSITTYENHFKAVTWPSTSSMVTYDYGV
jgi:hypothetical protein